MWLTMFFPQPGLVELFRVPLMEVCSLAGHLGNTLEAFFLVMQIQLLSTFLHLVDTFVESYITFKV